MPPTEKAEGSVGIVETQYFQFAEPPNEMPLDCGRKLGPITLAYETYGALNEDRSNAVLVLHALSGDAHAAGYHSPDDRQPGWWDTMIGPGKGFDTTKYFVICSNVLGGCTGSTGPSSIEPQTGKPYGLTFPIITIADMVRAQKALVEHLGIPKLLSVAGGSMGGMQALQWATRYPEMVQSAMVIASTAVNSAQSIAFDAVGRHAIQADPRFRHGQYYGEEAPEQGLAIARMLGHITYLSDESMRARFGRELRNADEYSYDLESEFAVETYLDYKGQQFVRRFDANSYLYVTKAIDYFDLEAEYGSLDKAMANVSGRMLVLSFSSDWLFPPNQSEQIVYALLRQKKDVNYCNIRSGYGHDAFLLETDSMKRIVSGFLAHAEAGARCCTGTDPAGTDQSRDEESPAAPSTERAPSFDSSIYRSDRVDYDMIVELIAPGSRVLDIGCGDGELLCRLICAKQVDGLGLEKAEDQVARCIRRGVSVVQADIDEGLNALPDNSYDYLTLSMTLQVIRNPEFVIREMLRVAGKCIVSFPNFAFWRARLQHVISGRAPVTRSLPYAWHLSPNRHVLSIRDFRTFCAEHSIAIEEEIPLSSRGRARFMANLLADEAVFVISARR